MKIAIYVCSGSKGVVLSVANELFNTGKYDVQIIACDSNTYNLSRKLLPHLKNSIINKSKIKPKFSNKRTLIERALDMEKITGEYCSMLISKDRAIGQGYSSNADKHPHIKRSFNSHKEKLKELVEQFEIWQQIYNMCKMQLLFSWQRPNILSLLLKSKGIRYVSFIHSRISNYYMFVDDVMLQNYNSIGHIKNELSVVRSNNGIEKSTPIYTSYESFNKNFSKIDNSYYRAFKESAYICVHELYKKIKGLSNPEGYIFCGWIPTIFRKIVAHKYWIKYGVTVDSMGDIKTVIFPLHMEPEISLMQVSPEFNNSFEIITWVSKNLPADVVLVIKENPWSFGIRSSSYYDRLRKIGNVVLASPDTNTKEWIERSLFTVAITGTSGIESIYYNKPVLSFGRYQIINELPTVRYVSSFLDTKNAIKDLYNLSLQKNDFIKSKVALHRAIMHSSFSLPNFSNYKKSDFLVDELGKVLSSELQKRYINDLS